MTLLVVKYMVKNVKRDLHQHPTPGRCGLYSLLEQFFRRSRAFYYGENFTGEGTSTGSKRKLRREKLYNLSLKNLKRIALSVVWY